MKSSYLALDDSRCAKQRVASDRLCNRFGNYSRLLSSRGEDEDERRRLGRVLTLEPSSTCNRSRSFSKHAPTAKYLHASHVSQRKMSSEDDSDVPEQISLSTSKRQAVGRRKDVAKELSQAKLKQKEHNRERDRQLKQQSSKQRTELTPDNRDAEPKDPRRLPDHLFATAFNQPSPAPEPSVPKGVPLKTLQKERKRSDLTPRDQIVGQAFSSPSKGIQMTLGSSSRAIRTLSKASERVAARRTLPSSSVTKFSSRALNTKGAVSLSRTRGWQRKPGERVPRVPRSTSR